MTLTQLDAELVARGFAGFSSADRTRYINWGYFHVARRTRWWWERTSEDLTFALGDFRKTVAATHDSTLKAVVTSPNDRRTALLPLSEDEFLENWYPLDLASSANRSTPTHYFVWSESNITYLYLTPPPDVAATIHHLFSQEVVALVSGSDATITPEEVDEGIILATLVRCHLRAHEYEQAEVMRSALEEMFDTQLSIDTFKMDEEVERVEPYPW